MIYALYHNTCKLYYYIHYALVYAHQPFVRANGTRKYRKFRIDSIAAEMDPETEIKDRLREEVNGNKGSFKGKKGSFLSYIFYPEFCRFFQSFPKFRIK